MNKFLTVLFFLCTACIYVQGQELYVYSEPASNMPSKSVALKLSGRFPQNNAKQRYMPEVMLGINKDWMVHVSTTLSNYYSNNVRLESGRAYAKYRFYSNDEVHKHFRMAAFGDVSLTRSPYLYHEVTLEGDNSGAQGGLIATQLVNKLAVSGTAAYTRVFKKEIVHQHEGVPSYDMLNYSLSAGYLLLPKDYTDYKQTNVNLYIEMLGMRSLDQKHYGVDLAPAVQFIFNSNTKINIGYRYQVAGNMTRIANKTFLLAVEHTLFNIWK
jgi:hypothetical protein